MPSGGGILRWLRRAHYFGFIADVGRLDCGLHPLRHFDAEESHAVAQRLGYVAGNDETREFLLIGVCSEDAVVVIELVELLGQFVAVVGYA